MLIELESGETFFLDMLCSNHLHKWVEYKHRENHIETVPDFEDNESHIQDYNSHKHPDLKLLVRLVSATVSDDEGDRQVEYHQTLRYNEEAAKPFENFAKNIWKIHALLANIWCDLKESVC